MLAEEESIYNLIPKEYVAPPKPAMHRSRFNGSTLPPTGSTFGTHTTSKPGICNLGGDYEEPAGGAHEFRKPGATFGVPKGSLKPNSSTFLRKSPNQTSPQRETIRSDGGRIKEPRKPAVPTRDEKPLMGLATSKNFVTSNAVENILTAAKKPLDNTKQFTKKVDYGRTPEYLQKIKADINDEYEFIRKMQEAEEEQKRSTVRVLTDEERDALLQGLKAQWEKINSQYQLITHVVTLDTIGKVRRKEQYEQTLAQIEKDIERINKKYIFVDTTQ
eukprot:GILJ01000499.1.p1 GENE.GILJ01000499.1~~GILJ01000499.1.p1  ORF type:complete len:274 (-),score=53.22 GILJ01000499.1:229-1050(-)